MSNLNVLKTELQDAAYSGMTDQEAADALNAAQSKVGPFGIYQIVNYFVMQKNKQASQDAAQILQLHTGMEIDYNNASHVALVSNAMDALIDANIGVDTADKTAVLALGDGRYTRSRAQELGFYNSIHRNHVAAARA